jgi:hypothetical protein
VGSGTPSWPWVCVRTVSGSVKLKIKLTGKARKARSVKLSVRAGAVTKRVTVKR